MLIFCNKWKLLHEKRVQSRKYFWGVYQHGRRVVLLLLFLFLFWSPCHPPSWSIAEISKIVSTLDLKHTDDTDSSVKRTSIANYVIHDPFEISEVNFVAVSVFVLFSMSPPSWSIAEISTRRVSTLDLKHTDDTDASVQRTSIAKLHNPLSL